MDNYSGISPAMLADQASQNDLIRRKLDMDALRKRLGDTSTKEEKLRESCEGFESIFLQKMWEQMRKTVPKEGYLHSKDEEMYQSLFDVELCKKMASAGGIGLADMLYEQLSQQLVNSGRTTSPGSYRIPLEIAPAGLEAVSRQGQTQQAAPKDAGNKPPLTVENLYSPLPAEGQGESLENTARKVDEALREIKVALGKAPSGEAGAAVREWAEARERATGAAGATSSITSPLPPDGQTAQSRTSGVQAPVPEGRDATPGLSPLTRADTVPATGAAAPSSSGAAPAGQASQKITTTASTQAADNVSSKPESVADAQRLFGRKKKKSKSTKADETAKAAPAQPRGMVPQGTLWPLAGEGGNVVSHFGWEDDASGGRRHWNSGVRIAAQPQSPVRAIMEGTVVYAGQREGYGHTVVMEHKDGFRSYYSNLTDASVRVGDRVAHGAEFAKIAAQASPPSKAENSASLYFELKKGEMALNPENAIERQGA